jgi:hypothetical protein
VLTRPGIHADSPWSDTSLLNYSKHNITRVRFCVAHTGSALVCEIAGRMPLCSSCWFISIWLMYAQWERAYIAVFCISPLAAAVNSALRVYSWYCAPFRWEKCTLGAAIMMKGSRVKCNATSHTLEKNFKLLRICIFLKVSKCALKLTNGYLELLVRLHCIHIESRNIQCCLLLRLGFLVC